MDKQTYMKPVARWVVYSDAIMDLDIGVSPSTYEGSAGTKEFDFDNDDDQAGGWVRSRSVWDE